MVLQRKLLIDPCDSHLRIIHCAVKSQKSNCVSTHILLPYKPVDRKSLQHKFRTVQDIIRYLVTTHFTMRVTVLIMMLKDNTQQIRTSQNKILNSIPTRFIGSKGKCDNIIMWSLIIRHFTGHKGKAIWGGSAKINDYRGMNHWNMKTTHTFTLQDGLVVLGSEVVIFFCHPTPEVGVHPIRLKHWCCHSMAFWNEQLQTFRVCYEDIAVKELQNITIITPLSVFMH